MTSRSGLFVLLVVAGFAFIAATESGAPLMPLALALLGAALIAITAMSHGTAGADRLLVTYAVRSAAADRSASPRQRDPDAPGHVRARAPGRSDRS
jgi:hypothetical protein